MGNKFSGTRVYLGFIFGVAFLVAISAVLFNARANKIAFAASTITVNSTADDVDNDGECTLREAIISANLDSVSGALAGECTAGSGNDDIVFSIPGAGVRTITPLTSLPPIESQVNINGYSQTGASANTAVSPAPLNGTLLIEIDGTNVANYALLFSGNSSGGASSSVRGLVINRFGAGGAISIGASNVTVAGNYIGTDSTGLVDLGNTGPGITEEFISTNSSNANIGGLNAADRNLISGNEDSASYPGDGWVFRGNYIGVDATGLVAMGNSAPGYSGGISIDHCTGVIIGGIQTGATNVISGNKSHGLAPDITDGLVIQGNYIGVGADSSTSLPNGGGGIVLTNSTDATIGGPSVEAKNIIKNNELDGIYLGSNNDGVVIEGNNIDSNLAHGINVDGGVNINIGDTATNAGNTVSFNLSTGILLNNTSFVAVESNIVNDNANTGIQVNNSTDIIIGGTATNAGNTVNGNDNNGIGIHNLSSNVTVQANTSNNNASNGIDLYNTVTDTVIQGNELNSNINNGLSIDGSNNITVGGAGSSSNNISLNNSNGVAVYSSSSTVFEGNIVDTNNGYGFYIYDSTSITVGGTTSEAGNSIKNNVNSGLNADITDGFEMRNNVIEDNGVNGIQLSFSNAAIINGGAVTGSSNEGIVISDSDNVVISEIEISINGDDGIWITNTSSTTSVIDSLISSNSDIGISLDNVNSTIIKGSMVLNNSNYGISIDGSSDSIIGGTSSAERNIISGNQGLANVAIIGLPNQSSNNTIQGNYIGTDDNGLSDSSISQNFGIILTANANSNTIGGTTPGSGNIIAGNKGAGIFINSLTNDSFFGTLAPINNSILNNSIFDNDSDTVFGISFPGLAIDSGGLILDENFNIVGGLNIGPTLNDAEDPDTGSNNYENFPVLNSAQQTDNTLVVDLNLDAADSTLNDQYRVEIFSSDVADESGYGEGRTYLGAANITNGNNKKVQITLPAGINLSGKVLSATTTALSDTGTGYGSTSEFSEVLSTISVYITPASGGLLGKTGDIITSWYGIIGIILSGSVLLYYRKSHNTDTSEK